MTTRQLAELASSDVLAGIAIVAIFFYDPYYQLLYDSC